MKVLFLALCAVLLVIVGISISTEGKDTDIIFDVFAYCEPNFRITGPHALNVSYTFRSGPKIEPEIIGIALVENDTFEPEWEGFGIPSSGWLSMVFPGFPIHGELFCQDTAEDKFIQFGYLSKEKTKLFLSLDGQSSNIEFERPENLGKSLRSILKIIPDQNLNFMAGNGTANPYWLQVAVPLQSPPSSQINIFYDFF